MNPITKLLGAALVGCAFLAPLARAQSQPADAGQPSQPAGATAPEGPGSWLLGRGYVQLDGSIDKFLHAPGASTGASPGLGFNVPLAPDYLDLSSHFDYEHAANTAFKLNDDTWSTALTGYAKLGGIAPFVSAGLGYDWQRGLSQGVFTRDNSLFYSLAAGFEVPVSAQTSLRATFEHDYDLASPHLNYWSGGVSANAWVNDVVGTFVGADWRDGYAGAKSGIVFTAGLRISFDSD